MNKKRPDAFYAIRTRANPNPNKYSDTRVCIRQKLVISASESKAHTHRPMEVKTWVFCSLACGPIGNRVKWIAARLTHWVVVEMKRQIWFANKKGQPSTNIYCITIRLVIEINELVVGNVSALVLPQLLNGVSFQFTVQWMQTVPSFWMDF